MILEDDALTVKSLGPSALSTMDLGTGIWTGNPPCASLFKLAFQEERVLYEQTGTLDVRKTHPFQTLVCPERRIWGSQMQ